MMLHSSSLTYVLKRWEKNTTTFGPYLRGPKSRAGRLIAVLLISYGCGILAVIMSSLMGYARLNLTRAVEREIASLVLLIPLYAWYVWRGRVRALQVMIEESRKRSLLLPFVLIAFAFLSSEIAIIFVVVLTIILVEGYKPSCFGFTFRKLPRLLGLGGFLLASALLPIAFGLGIHYGWSALPSVLSVMGFDLASLPLTLLYAVFIIGVAEEGLYRGYVQTKFGRIIGIRKAILLQAVFFASWHFDRRFALEDQVFRLLQVFLFGVLVGVYYWQTRSLIGTVLFHGLWDTFVFNARGVPRILFSISI